MKSLIVLHARSLARLIVGTLFVSSAHGITYTWIGGGNQGSGTRWTDSSHWSGGSGGIPGSGDTVVIGNSALNGLDTQGNRTITQLDLQRTTSFSITGGNLSATNVIATAGHSSTSMSGTLTATTVQMGGGTLTTTGMTVGSLSGVGTIGGNVAVSTTHSVGGNGTIGTQTFNNTLTYSSGSIFSWDLSVTTPGSTSSATTYDKVAGGGAIAGSGATFAIVLGTGTFADAFWNVNHTWSDIFGGDSISSVFSSISTLAPGSEGSFSLSGSTLTWTAVPEPGAALAGLLVAAGLMRRRRTAEAAVLA